MPCAASPSRRRRAVACGSSRKAAGDIAFLSSLACAGHVAFRRRGRGATVSHHAPPRPRSGPACWPRWCAPRAVWLGLEHHDLALELGQRPGLAVAVGGAEGGCRLAEIAGREGGGRGERQGSAADEERTARDDEFRHAGLLSLGLQFGDDRRFGQHLRQDLGALGARRPVKYAARPRDPALSVGM